MGEFGWAIGVGIIILAVSVGRAVRALSRGFADRAVRGQAAGSAADPELRAEVDGMQRRLTELEERLDFTERLLAKHRDSERLAPPGPMEARNRGG